MYRNEWKRNQDIIDLGYCVRIPWAKHGLDLIETEIDMDRWCEAHYGRSTFAWTLISDSDEEVDEYYFTCQEHAFDFKMRWG